jgi:PAS domain S-box-containing protein
MPKQHAIRKAVSKWVLATLVLGLAGSAMLAWLAERRNRDEAREAFNLLSVQVADRLAKRIQLYEYGLRGARGVVLVMGAEHITRALFRRYSESRNIDHEFPGARGFGFIRRVPRERIPDFLAQARAEGPPDFKVVQLGANDGERFVIQYIEPLARNLPAVGLDVGSEANRRNTAMASMRTGSAVMTAPITLVQKTREPLRSVLFLLPIYGPGLPIGTDAEREAACVGWSYVALSLEEVLSDFQLDTARYSATLSDVTHANHSHLLFATPRLPDMVAPGLNRILEMDLYGRRWRLEFGMGVLLTMLVSSVVGLVRAGRERRRIAAAQKGQLATIVENSSDAIIGEAMDGTVISWNRAAQRLFGYEETEVLSRPLATLLLPPARHREDADLLGRIGAGEVIPPFDTTRLHRDGTAIDVSVTAGAMRGENRELIGVAKLMRDIRERKEAERQLQGFAASLERQVQERTAALQQATIEAEAANTAKSMFLANMSHEIRTPMNAVIGAAYLLDTPALDEGQRQLLGKLQMASRSLLGIINDVLDLAKIEAGELHIDKQIFSPGEVMDDVEQLFASQASDKGVVLQTIGRAELPARLMGDAMRLRQVLVNLVSNAVKFTHQGEVSVTVRREAGTGTDAPVVWLRWCVKDSGIGIAPDIIGRLFTPFMQADASTTRRFGGTGLGLSIVRQLVRRMGGEVEVRSTPGQGSVFEVLLPFEVVTMTEGGAALPSTPAMESGGLKGLRLLLVDDSVLNLEIGKGVLEREGAIVETCINGQEAVERLRRRADVDAVLMDVQMPVMDGYEATMRIRSELGLRALPVLALTAGALSEERRKAGEAGMDEFLTKPLDPVSLVRTLRAVVARNGPV